MACQFGSGARGARRRTWSGSGDPWRFGGGTFSQTGVYDPATGLTIWSAGHPIPQFEPGMRPGDNLFTNSAIAVDVATGAIRWHFQYTPGNWNGFSEAGTHQLVPAEKRFRGGLGAFRQ